MTELLSGAVRIEDYRNRVEIQLAGHVLAQSNNALLLIETYAPDIYFPISAVSYTHLTLPTILRV